VKMETMITTTNEKVLNCCNNVIITWFRAKHMDTKCAANNKTGRKHGKSHVEKLIPKAACISIVLFY